MMDGGRARCCVLLLGLASACGRARNEVPGRQESAPTELERAIASEAGTPLPALGGAAAALELAAPEFRPSEPVGGRWVSCYANYRPTSTPERDVARLAAMCGPPNGMIAVGPVRSGDALDAAEDHRLEAEAGNCFRIFAVADAFVSDLGVEVISPRGHAITWDRNGDRWPVLDPNGPFCLFDAGTYTIRARALSGQGRYALQIWRLP